MRYAQSSFDGISVDRTKGRFAGVFDLEDTEASAAALDEVLVCAVVVRVRGIAPILTKGGELEVTKRFDVTDMRVITDDDLRDKVITGCGLYGADTQPTLFTNPPPTTPIPPADVDEDGVVGGQMLAEIKERYADLDPDLDDGLGDEDEDEESGPVVMVGSIRNGPRTDGVLSAFLDE